MEVCEWREGLAAGCRFEAMRFRAFSSEFSLMNVFVKIILPRVLFLLDEVHMYQLSPRVSYEELRNSYGKP